MNRSDEYKSTSQTIRATPEEYETIMNTLKPRARTVVLTRYADPDVVPAHEKKPRRNYIVRFIIKSDEERKAILALTPLQRTAYLLEMAQRLPDLEVYARERYGISAN